jgi:hypothetical protein
LTPAIGSAHVFSAVSLQSRSTRAGFAPAPEQAAAASGTISAARQRLIARSLSRALFFCPSPPILFFPSLPAYSYRSASIASTAVARRAGT